jgi:hypothetical protein
MQLSYYRGESRFSDHRPVCGTFVVEVDVLNKRTKRRSSNADMRIGAEELLPMGKGKGNLYLLLKRLMLSVCYVRVVIKKIVSDQRF